jgi:hypothetical protein
MNAMVGLELLVISVLDTSICQLANNTSILPVASATYLEYVLLIKQRHIDSETNNKITLTFLSMPITPSL